MIKRITERWKELREDCAIGFGKMSVKNTLIFMIKEAIQNKWTSFIINRYGRDCGYLRYILDVDGKDSEALPFEYRYRHLSFLYDDSKEDTKEDILNKLIVSVKLLYNYQALIKYMSYRLKTSAQTEQYHDVAWKMYGETQIWTDWGECDGFMTEGHCEHCDKYIKEESDRIKEAYKLK